MQENLYLTNIWKSGTEVTILSSDFVTVTVGGNYDTAVNKWND